MPDWTAGARLEVVVTLELLRQFSVSGDPSDTSNYQIGVLREEEGRGGSRMLLRIFKEGRLVFISKPINYFELNEGATKTFHMGGEIGITPMIAFAHRLHALGHEFELYYSVSRKAEAGFIDDLEKMSWADPVQHHFSDQGSRADLDDVLSGYQPGWHVYSCGPDRFMDGVMAAAERQGFPQERGAWSISQPLKSRTMRTMRLLSNLPDRAKSCWFRRINPFPMFYRKAAFPLTRNVLMEPVVSAYVGSFRAKWNIATLSCQKNSARPKSSRAGLGPLQDAKKLH